MRKSLARGFTRKLVELRRQHPNLHRPPNSSRTRAHRFPAARLSSRVNGPQRSATFCGSVPMAVKMTPEEWNAGWVRCIGVSAQWPYAGTI